MRIERTGGGPPQGSSPTTHVAKEGETLQSVAQNYGLSKEALAEANTLPVDAAIQVGQELIVFAADKLVKERTLRGLGDIRDSFEVGAGAKAFVEGAVAKAFAEGTAPTNFAEGAGAKAFVEGAVAKAFAEGTAPTNFAEGAGAKAFVEGAVAKAFVESNFQSYSIQTGDTLESIAGRFGISAEELATANNLAADTPILTGTKLKVPTK